MKIKSLLIFAVVIAVSATAAAFELGKKDAVIYYNARNKAYAEELSFYLNKIFGKKYTLKAVKKISALPGIFVGLKPKQDKINVPADKEFTAISAYGDQLFIYGRDNRYLDCTGYAVAEFLEKHAGLRVLWPSELGIVAEPKSPVTVKEGLELYVPPFDIRLTSSYLNGRTTIDDSDWKYLVTWARHRKIGSSIRRRGSGFQHAFASLFPRAKYGKSHPEYYSLVTPEKWIGSPKPTVPTRTNEYGPDQICTSNPDVRRLVVEKIAAYKDDRVHSISANDGFGFCECANCKAQDGPDVNRFRRDHQMVTNRMHNFALDVATRVKKINPKAKVGMFAYGFYDGIPDFKIKYPGNMYLSYCYSVYGAKNIAEENLINDKLLALSATGAKVVGREYWGTHYTMNYPLSHSRKIDRNLKTLLKGNAAGIYGEPGKSFATRGSDHYILTKLAWDPTLKREDILREFCLAAFGPKAAPVMYELYEKIEDWTQNGVANKDKRGVNFPYYNNSYAEFNRLMSDMYNDNFIKMCNGYFRKAAKLVDTPERKARLEYVKNGIIYAKYITAALVSYRDLAAMGMNMSLTQPSGLDTVMERSEIIKVATRAVEASKAKRNFAVKLGKNFGFFHSTRSDSINLRPWQTLSEIALSDLRTNTYNFLVNGAFEYTTYSWDITGSGKYACVYDVHCDSAGNYMVHTHANQGISIKVDLDAGQNMKFIQKRKIGAKEKNVVSGHIMVKCDGNPVDHVKAWFGGKKIELKWANEGLNDKDGWNELRFKAFEIEPGTYDFRMEIVNPKGFFGGSAKTFHVDDLKVQLKQIR
ncbi:MAG: DUF4838 domain-containing protein [Lentisphaerae bacterium]|nr:DUF4838 domain-containing protein [Lentisphaerota bacterium]